MVFDLDFARHAVIKLNGEGGMALDDGRGWGGRGRRSLGYVRILGGDFMELHPRCLLVLEVLGGNLKVAGLTVVRRKDRLWLGV